MKAFLSEAIQTFVSLLRRKEARTIRMKMKMTIILMTPTIKINERVLLREGSIAVTPWSGSANHIQSSKREDTWKALTSTERTSPQCNPPFPDEEITGPRSLVLGAELETEPSSK